MGRRRGEEEDGPLVAWKGSAICSPSLRCHLRKKEARVERRGEERRRNILAEAALCCVALGGEWGSVGAHSLQTDAIRFIVDPK
ncbi:hypothetical protein EYF80_050229 [Liparis tanakae]|uniref:Uncharacterized protein n=1 Tax=Liparis tanakae TaxID=230148 RepID=A0A4Z2FEM2_9TELE|nr:hypothetical protein EYF80_050229 [Liparis tanakae]